MKEKSKTEKKTYYNFPVDENDIGRRIDRVLRKILSNIPLSGIYKLLRSGEIKLNNAQVLPSYRLKKNDIITLPKRLIKQPPDQISSKRNSNPIRLGKNQFPIRSLIIEETEDFIAINKPRGILVHGKNSLNTALLDYLKNSQETHPAGLRAFTPGPIHRLDRNTSGIILFSKSLKGAKEISNLFKDHKIIKIYLTIVEGEITQNLILKDILYRDTNKKKSMVLKIPDSFPKDTSHHKATTQLAITYVYPLVTRNKLTLAICVPITGKTHQIRAQLANAGYPLFGDNKYGSKKIKGGFFLHALQIIVKGKRTVKGLKNFFAPIPKESYIMLENNFGKISHNKITEKAKEIAENM